MYKVNVYLTPRQLDALKKKSEELGISYAEILRRVLDAWIEQEEEEKRKK